MISTQQINQLIQKENADAIDIIYWELPTETQRIIDKMVAEHWRAEVSALSDF